MKTDWPSWTLLGGAPYTPSHATSIADTFRRVKRQMELEQRERERRAADEYIDELAAILDADVAANDERAAE